jgi:AraC-like DNA-binding protein
VNPIMDALNDWIRAIRAEGVVLVRTRVAGSWGFSVPPRDAVVFHFVANGHAFVRQRDAETVELRSGELVLFPRGSAHEVAHSARGKTMPVDAFLAKRDGVVDRDAKATTLICGQYNLDQHLALPALRALPLAVSLHAGIEPGRSPLGDTLRMLSDEVETPNFGNQIVVRSLIASLFVYFIREWAEASSSGAGDWFSAMRSPSLAQALTRMHGSPNCAWTIEELAREAGLSRAAFARHFTALIGEPPHSYLTRWRMGIAAQLLKETDLRVAEIASRVGYRSEFSFSRAFKSVRGIAPIHYRRAIPNPG